jgi:hypothetical protein
MVFSIAIAIGLAKTRTNGLEDGQDDGMKDRQAKDYSCCLHPLPIAHCLSLKPTWIRLEDGQDDGGRGKPGRKKRTVMAFPITSNQ